MNRKARKKIMSDVPNSEADFQNTSSDAHRMHSTLSDKLGPEAVELYIQTMDFADPNDPVKPTIAAKLRTFAEYLRDDTRMEFSEQSKSFPETQ